MKDILQSEGLTPAQALFLGMLGERGPMSVSQIATSLGVSSSAITLLADRLHQAGLLLRERDEEDRRVVVLTMTEAGKAIRERLTEQRFRILQALLARLSLQDVEALSKILDQLSASVEERDLVVLETR